MNNSINSTAIVVTICVKNFRNNDGQIDTTTIDKTNNKSNKTIAVFPKYWYFNIATREINTYLNSKIALSNCVLEGIHQLLNFVKLSNSGELNELYCIGPTYSTINNTQKFSDTQFTITGNLNVADIENSINATLARELGIWTDYYSLIQIGNKFEHQTPHGNIQYVTNYILDIANCNFYTGSTNLNRQNISNNRTAYIKSNKNKFQILLFGSMDDCMSKLENITNFYRPKLNCSNKIIGLSMMKLTDIEKIINKQYQWLKI